MSVKRDKHTRQAVKSLSNEEMRLFEMLEDCEQGEISGVLELCEAIKKTPSLVTFSCLSGESSGQVLGDDLGALFRGTLNKKAKQFLARVVSSGYQNPFTVFIDDCEPVRVWQWSGEQSDFTQQCRTVVERTAVPENWRVLLWSDFERGSEISFAATLEEISKCRYDLLVSRTLEQMKKFPNKKLRGDLKQAAVRRVANYALQGLVLEEKMPGAVLCQTETPWNVKDCIYNPLRVKNLPIIHPFPQERR